MDPFCGCGTTIDAAEKLGRRWIGIDLIALAISLIKNRLLDTYGSRMKFVTASDSGSSRPVLRSNTAESGREEAHSPSQLRDPSLVTSAPTAESVHLVRIIGEPTSPNEAGLLADQDKFQFQWWALGLVGARPIEQKKGADHGIDGKIFFRDDPRAAKPEQIIRRATTSTSSACSPRLLPEAKAAAGSASGDSD